MTEEQLLIWENRLKEIISPPRLAHSQRVARLAQEMSKHWGLDPFKAGAAGILHDVAREMSIEEYFRIAKKAAIPLGPGEIANPIILHAPVGAEILKTRWGINDKDILQAVAGHTIASPNMSAYTKIIFLADNCEPGRKWQGAEELRRLMKEDLNKAMLFALNELFTWLKGENLPLHPLSLEAYNHFIKLEKEQN